MSIYKQIFVTALLVVFYFFDGSQVSAGVSCDTIVQTQNGPMLLKILKIGDKIFCSNMQNLAVDEKAITSIEEINVPRVIEITTSDNVTFHVAADQKLFVTHKWVEAQQLTLEDVLMTKDSTFVKVVSIRYLEEPMILRFITVEEHHNFFAAENGVLVHNGAWGAWAGCTLSMSITQFVYHATVVGVSSLAGPAAPGVAGVIYLWTLPAATTATYAVGIAGGIAGAVATGPV